MGCFPSLSLSLSGCSSSCLNSQRRSFSSVSESIHADLQQQEAALTLVQCKAMRRRLLRLLRQESALELDGAVIPPLLDQKVCNRSHFSDGGQTYLGFVPAIPSECHHLETYTPFVCCRPHDLTFCHIWNPFSFAWRSCRRDWDIWLNWRDVCEADACR